MLTLTPFFTRFISCSQASRHISSLPTPITHIPYIQLDEIRRLINNILNPIRCVRLDHHAFPCKDNPAGDVVLAMKRSTCHL